MFAWGNLKPELNIAFRYAVCTSSPKHATSPVEDISTPRVTSAPASLSNYKINKNYVLEVHTLCCKCLGSLACL